MLDDIFAGQKTYTATFKSERETWSSGSMIGKSWIVVGTAECLVWDASMVNNDINDKFREDTDTIAVFKHSALGFATDGRVTIDSKDYTILFVDNIANQDEVVQMLLKRFV